MKRKDTVSQLDVRIAEIKERLKKGQVALDVIDVLFLLCYKRIKPTTYSSREPAMKHS